MYVQRNNLRISNKVMLFKRIMKLHLSLKLFLSHYTIKNFLNTNKRNSNMNSIIMNRLWWSQNLMKKLLLFRKRSIKKYNTNKFRMMLTNRKKTSRFIITSQSLKKKQNICRLNKQLSNLLFALSLKRLIQCRIKSKSNKRKQSYRNIKITINWIIMNQRRASTRKLAMLRLGSKNCNSMIS